MNLKPKTFNDDDDSQSSSDDNSYSSESSSSYGSDSDSSTSDKSSSQEDDNGNYKAAAQSPSSYHRAHNSSTMRQRRGRHQPQHSFSQREDDIERHSSPKKRSPKVKRRKVSKKKWSRYLLRIYYVWCRLSSYFLMLALLIWILVQIYGIVVESNENPRGHRVFANGSQPQSKHLEEAKALLWNRNDADEDGENNNNLASWFGFNNKKEKKENKEAIPDGCELQEWQQIGHPNCMEVHQLDLSWLLKDAFSKDGQTNGANNTKTLLHSGKYLSSGMWRDVFRLPADGYPTNNNEYVVFKMMKSEHDVDDRNLERHKREAIVMDVLTKSPHIVNLFSYCGNSVLTEYLPMDLEDYLRPKRRRKRRRKVRRGQPIVEEQAPEDTPRVTTPEERLDLAFQTVKALEELHRNDIIHADLQSKQFLVDLDEKTFNVTIKLNDFNRCRFLPREKQNATTGSNNNDASLSDVAINPTSMSPSICPIHIPTAPGLARSPEEYDMQLLTTQLDIYSLANVWYQILTGSTPWVDQANVNVVKNLILHGKKPPLTEDQTKATSDATLADLLYKAYEVDPNERATAKDLLEGLEHT